MAAAYEPGLAVSSASGDRGRPDQDAVDDAIGQDAPDVMSWNDRRDSSILARGSASTFRIADEVDGKTVDAWRDGRDAVFDR